MAQLEKFSLKVFRSVAEHLSFRKAAELLSLTQPAVTLQIQALEQDLGARLFDRAAGKVSLTKQGAILFCHAQKIAKIALEAVQELSANEVQLSGTFALGVSTTIAQYVLPRLLATFLAEHPRLKLSVHSANTDAIVTLLLDNKVSIGLIAGPARQRGLHAEPFMEDELVLIASRDFEFDHLSHGQLTASTLLLREPGSGSRRVVEAALRKERLKLSLFKNVIELDSTEAIKSAAEAGLGLAFVSYCAINKELELESLKIVELNGVRITRQYSVVFLTGPEPSGAADAFRTFALDRARHLSKPPWKSTRSSRALR
jgi:LysR family transcriptional regulator, transcriptional activator of the cysJI operon